MEAGSWPELCISGQIFLYILSVLFWVDLEIIERKTGVKSVHLRRNRQWSCCSYVTMRITRLFSHLLPWAPPSSLLLDGRIRSRCSCLHPQRWHQRCWWWIQTPTAFLSCSALKLHHETLRMETQYSNIQFGYFGSDSRRSGAFLLCVSEKLDFYLLRCAWSAWCGLPGSSSRQRSGGHSLPGIVSQPSDPWWLRFAATQQEKLQANKRRHSMTTRTWF